MKKSLIFFCLFIVFLIVFFLQTNIFDSITIAGVMPNIIIIYIIFVALFTNTATSIGISILSGFIIDFSYSSVIGITPFMYCVIAYLVSYFDKNFSKESKITVLFIIVLSTIFYEFGHYLLNIAIQDFEMEFVFFIKKLLIETLYNLLISIIIYPVFQKFGYSLDRVFKHNNVLTRYF